MDTETEAIMQEIIDIEFKHTTVLAIMHRLDHIDKYEKVAMLDQGQLVEYDEPAKLMMEDSRFAESCRSNALKRQ